MLCATNTRPLTVAQFQVLLDMETMVARFAARKVPVYLDHGTSIPCRLVFQLPSQFVPTAVCYRPCETVVLHHILDSKSFQIDDLVFVNQFLGRLMQMVLPNVLDLLVYSRQLDTKFLDTHRLLVGTLVPPLAQLPLNSLEFLPQSPVRLDVLVLLTVTIHHQGLDAEINPDFLLDWLVLFDLFLDHQRAVVLSCLVFGNGAERDFFLDRLVYHALDAFQELRHDQFAIYQLDVLRYTEALLIMLALELRELGTLLKEITVCRIEVLDGLLQGLAAYLGQPSDRLLQRRQFFAVTDEVVATSSSQVFLFASCEEVVVQVTCAAEVFGE